jgi:hypothetical protein
MVHTGCVADGPYRRCGRWSIQAVWPMVHTGCVADGPYRLCGRWSIQAVWPMVHTGGVADGPYRLYGPHGLGACTCGLGRHAITARATWHARLHARLRANVCARRVRPEPAWPASGMRTCTVPCAHMRACTLHSHAPSSAAALSPYKHAPYTMHAHAPYTHTRSALTRTLHAQCPTHAPLAPPRPSGCKARRVALAPSPGPRRMHTRRLEHGAGP